MRINTRLSPRVQLQYRVPERRNLGTRLRTNYCVVCGLGSRSHVMCVVLVPGHMLCVVLVPGHMLCVVLVPGHMCVWSWFQVTCVCGLGSRSHVVCGLGSRSHAAFVL